MSTMITTQPDATLTRADRCDATCPAGAMVRVTTKDLGTFLFCGHHWDLNKEVMPGVLHVHDERNPIDRLIKNAETETTITNNTEGGTE